MGGLSAANFLARYGKRVLVLEKHRVPGGLVTSFPRKGVHFDLGIHGLYELGEGQTIPQFMRFWNAPRVETVPLRGDLKCFIGEREHRFQHGRARESFLESFPKNRDDVNRVFDVMETIVTEMFSGTEAPEPPYDMNFLQLIRFGMAAKRQRPTFMRYGSKDAYRVLDSLTTSDELKTAIYSKAPYPMVFMAFAYQWGVYGSSLYPSHGMQAISGAAAAKGRMKRAISGRRPFPPAALLFMSLDENKYRVDGLEGIGILSSKDYRMRTEEYTPDTAPIVINIYPRREDDEYRPLVALAPLSYEYRNCWETGADWIRGERYRELKHEVEATLLSRIGERMGRDFVAAVSHHELSSPITFERYTYSKNGSFMGWSIRQSEYGRYLRQRTEIRDLYLVGQWVFPGFGVAGVMASGYYLAKEILKSEGIDLKREFAGYFATSK